MTMEEQSKPTIGFIGLGHMGSHMVPRLIAAGYHLIVYDRTREKAQAIEGATVAETPTAVRKKIEPLKLSRDSGIISTVGEPPTSISRRNSGKRIFQCGLKGLTGACTSLTEKALDLGECLFNRRQIWRICWKKEQLTFSFFKNFAYLEPFMDA